MKWESILDITRCDIPTSQSGGKSFNVYPFSWVITTLDRTLATNRPCPPLQPTMGEDQPASQSSNLTLSDVVYPAHCFALSSNVAAGRSPRISLSRCRLFKKSMIGLNSGFSKSTTS